MWIDLRSLWESSAPPAAPDQFVPAPKLFAFGEFQRDPTIWNFRLPTVVPPNTAPIPYASPPTVTWVPWTLRDYGTRGAPTLNTRGQPVPYAPVQPPARPDWTLKDYDARQDRVSALETPVPPIPGMGVPQFPFPVPWALRDYGTAAIRLILAPTSIPSIALPPFFAAPVWALREYGIASVKFLQAPVSAVPPVKLPVLWDVPRDMTAHLVVLRVNGIPVANIPGVVTQLETYPIGFSFIRLGGSYG